MKEYIETHGLATLLIMCLTTLVMLVGMLIGRNIGTTKISKVIITTEVKPNLSKENCSNAGISTDKETVQYHAVPQPGTETVTCFITVVKY